MCVHIRVYMYVCPYACVPEVSLRCHYSSVLRQFLSMGPGAHWVNKKGCFCLPRATKIMRFYHQACFFVVVVLFFYSWVLPLKLGSSWLLARNLLTAYLPSVRMAFFLMEESQKLCARKTTHKAPSTPWKTSSLNSRWRKGIQVSTR